jgi:LPPG:FO 2-phospho-L-lactate transferase
MTTHRYLALTGGIGGAKLGLGLAKVLNEDELAFVVNTGDDFKHLGLHISPDIDTLVYTLAGENNPETGWGRRDESWHFMSALETLGGETWFRLGDKDLAVNVERTERLRRGATLSKVTAELANSLGVKHKILPMSNDPVRTVVHTEDGRMDFQDYFVREGCRPAVASFEYRGAATARVNPDIVEWLGSAQLAGIILCPSNPFISIDPILSLPGLQGPLKKMMREVTVPTSASWIAEHYRDFVDGFVVDIADESLASEIEAMGVSALATNTVMKTLDDRVKLAETSLGFIASLTEGQWAKAVPGD